MSRSVMDLGIDGLQATAADQEMLDEGESKLSDVPAPAASMDIDSHSLQFHETLNPMYSETDRFSVQNRLPLEVVEMIAIRTSNDADLMNFTLACKDFATATVLQKSTVWRRRFLAHYDHPIIDGPYEFRVAYQLRELVLRKFPSFRDGGGRRGKIALEVLKDLVLESYHGPQSTSIHPSKNLYTLSSPGRAPYMYEFLSSPFFAYGKYTYGKPNSLFDALQIVFAHMVLHPESEFAIPSDFDARLSASRDNYDLSVVYLHSTPLKTLYRGDPAPAESYVPNLTLDLNALLHIRNFWHGHLATSVTSMYADAVPTYGNMARFLIQQGHAPQPWDRPLHQVGEVLPRWFGHYSCTHPTPRKLCDIEEHQTCAEDWINSYGEDGVHPLTLDISTSTVPQCDWWPPIFAGIPFLESTLPAAHSNKWYSSVRGIAPFLAPYQSPGMYPAYTALRVRGIIHSLPEQIGIPGWRRIVMILYRPTSRYLLAVLDQNSPPADESNPFGQVTPIQSLQTSHVNPAACVDENQTQMAAPNEAQTPAQPQNLVQGQGQGQGQPAAESPTPEEAEKILNEKLEAREELKGSLGPTYHTRELIANMEDNLHPPGELSWEDLSYGYIYEGILIPGGKIMMGRYWRFGPPSVVDGFELGGGADRGPWVFWC